MAWQHILKRRELDDMTFEEAVAERNRRLEREELARGKFGGDANTEKFRTVGPYFTLEADRGSRAKAMPRSIMADYFKMYKTMHNRVPTLKEIEEEESRQLTSDEINEYHKEYKRTMGGKV